jgi:hypothetical protein
VRPCQSEHHAARCPYRESRAAYHELIEIDLD